MWPYSELGIDPTTDERAIKRAYARELKDHRPDEDPQGFQRLHEAYQAALQRSRASGSSSTVPAQPDATRRSASTPPASGAAVAAPVAPPPGAAPIAFDADGFLREAISQADANEPGLLRRWLESNEALWSLGLKTRVGHRWLAVVHQVAPPMPDGCFDAMLAFFHLDHAGAVQDPLALQQSRQRMHLSWYLAPGRRSDLARALGANTVSERKQAIRALERLQRPFGWASALRQALWPRTVRSTGEIIRRLAGHPPVQLPPPVDPRQQAFWLQAAHGGLFSRVGLAIAATQMTAGLLASIVFGVCFSLVGTVQEHGFDWRLAGGTTAAGALLCGVLLAFALWSELTAWQRHFVPFKGPTGWLHFALVPLLALCALVVVNATDAPMVGWLFTVPALWLALARVLYGRHFSSSSRTWLRLGIFLIYPIASLVAGAVQVPVIMGNALTGAALLAWGIDAWRRRPLWRQAATA